MYIQQTEDSLIHFCWKDRSTGVTEDDLIMFPGDAEFEKVAQCTTGRVFVLKFKSNNKRCFYWMQEPKDDKDDEFKTKVGRADERSVPTCDDIWSPYPNFPSANLSELPCRITGQPVPERSDGSDARQCESGEHFRRIASGADGRPRSEFAHLGNVST